jgi:hypothetical protein
MSEEQESIVLEVQNVKHVITTSQPGEKREQEGSDE